MYYFTFGSKGHVFAGGWVRIKADTLPEAQQKFIKHYGDRAWRFNNNKDVLACAFFYTDAEFKKTIMYEDGDNLGAGEHEYIE